MSFTAYLKGQLIDFVEVYKKYYRQTLDVTIIFTIVCFFLAALLLRFSNFDKTATAKQISLLSYFFHRYSKADTYSIIDLTKTVFIFIVSIFSIGLSRILQDEIKAKKFTLNNFFKSIKIKDILFLVTTFVIASVLDFILYRLDYFSALNSRNKFIDLYFHDTLFSSRIYFPLIAFSLTIYFLTTTSKKNINIKRLLLLYISLWFFNEFAFEFSTWVRSHLFGLLLMPFAESDNYYLFESFVGVPLIAFYFLGYYSAMTTSLKLTENNSRRSPAGNSGLALLGQTQ